jgi:hypothetical protein
MNIHQNRYDEIKDLLRKSKMILEQETNDYAYSGEKLGQPNLAKSIENKIQNDVDYETAEEDEVEGKSPSDKAQAYRISGGIMVLHGKDEHDTDITTDDKIAFQETMDEFVEEVSDLVDFNELNVYPNNVEWSGKVIDYDLEFVFSIGETNGVYINGKMMKVSDDFLDFVTKLKQYYDKFKSKWAKVLASRKKTPTND